MTGYVKRYSTENRANYFEFINEDYNDGIFFENILDGTFTNYTEEVNSADNEFNCIASSFSIAFSLADSIRSNAGLTVKEFFKPSDNIEYKYAISLNLGSKEIGGVMNTQGTTVDKSFMSGRWDITLEFISWEAELNNYCITPTAGVVTSPESIDDFITNHLFEGVSNGISNRPRMNFDLNFNWNDRIGFTPVLIFEAYNQMLRNGISENSWSLFKELAYGLGFAFRLVTNGLVPLNTNFIKVTLWCGWRSEGRQHRTIQMLEPHTETNQINAAKFLFLGYRNDTASNQIRAESRFSGIMKNVDDLYINDGQNISSSARDFLNVDSADFQSLGNTIKCKGVIRNLEDPIVPFPFDETPISQVKVIHRIYYFIDRGGEPDFDTDNKYFLINSYHVNTVSDIWTSTVAFCRLFVKPGYAITPVPGIPLGLRLFEIQDEGWYDQDPELSLIQKTAGVEYDYLLKGNCNIINTDIHFDSNTELDIYDTVTVNEVDYWVRRITNINLSFDPSNGQRASIELVEI